MRRRERTELLDSDSGTPKEVADSLLDLRWFNRWFGGISTTRALIEGVIRKTGLRELSLLEVASGEGFIPAVVSRELDLKGIKLRITLLDRVASHFPRNGSIPKIAGDALTLPFRDQAFDVVCSSLFVHHLSPENVVQFAREALRISRLAVLVHDLIRHPVHLALAYSGIPLYRSRLTRNDASASVWQAYTPQEMSASFRAAGAARVEVQRHYLFRMGLTAWKQRPAA